MSQVASLGASTGIVGMPDGTVMVLDAVRLGSPDPQRRAAADAGADAQPRRRCNDGEQGLLGVALDEDFKVNGFVYLYYTRPSPGSPGGCVNRVSRFTMAGDVIDPASEIVLVDNISSKTATTTVAISRSAPTASCTSRSATPGPIRAADSSPNNAAQDLSLLNGKILRVVPSTGEPAPGNPLSGPGHGQLPRSRQPARRRRPPRARSCTPGACATRSASRSIPTPARSGSSSTTSARAPARRSTTAASAGTTAGRSARASARSARTRRAQRRPGAGFTDPITDYARSVGRSSPPARSSPTATGRRSTTAATCSPTPAAATCGCAARTARSTTQRRSPSSVGGIADMAFVIDERQHRALLHDDRRRRSARSPVRRRRSFATPDALAFVAVPARDAGARHPAADGRRQARCGPTPLATCRWVSIRP